MNWFVQTIYFSNTNDSSLQRTPISLSDFWQLAKEKGKSENQGHSGYKISFYDSSLIDPNDHPQKVYPSMQQGNVNFITIPNFIAKDKFDTLNKTYLITTRFTAGPNSIYNENSQYIWQTTLLKKENSNKYSELGSIQYLTEGIKIWKITKNDKTYIRFLLPKNSVKVTLNSEEFFNDFENSFYIDITNWK